MRRCICFSRKCSTERCISFSRKCSIGRCTSFSRKCSTRRCTSFSRKCSTGRCISEEIVCDGRGSCDDNSDELLCTCESKYDLVTCPGGSVFTDCIPKQWVCDGHPDCPGGSEEQCCFPCSEGNAGCRICSDGTKLCTNHYVTMMHFTGKEPLPPVVSVLMG